MRTVKPPETRKQEILSGAMTVFLAKGYEKSTIADIAKELGISQGLCYRYFASKEEIYEAVIDSYAAIIAEDNLSRRPKAQPIAQWLDSIPAMLAAMEKAEAESPSLYSLLHKARNAKMHRDLCIKVVEKLLPAVTKVLEDARDAGEIQLSNCAQTAAFGLYGEIGLLCTEAEDCSAAIKENWRMLLGAKK